MAHLPESVHTVVIGAGQGGLLMSRHLTAAGREHLVLDRRPTLGGGWLDRWDAFQLVTPNFVTALPGFPYEGDSNGFMTRDEITGRIAAYAAAIEAPVSLGTNVTRVAADVISRGRFAVETNRGVLAADEVIVATGAFHVPRIPTNAGFVPRIHQLHAHDYRNEASLPPGGVLVIGSGQTGVQLAEELHAAGRRVTISVGHCWRMPRRYRGRDSFWWMRQIALTGAEVGVTLPTVETLPDPRARFACNPHLSGHGGGHDTNLRRFAAEGMRLVGRFAGSDGERARFAADLGANLAYADEFFGQRFRPMFDAYIERAAPGSPPDDDVPFAFNVPEVTDLDLAAEGISTVLWTTGYAPDYSWLDLPVIGADGLPRHVRGVSEVPGLTFIGLLWQHNQASANLVGVPADAEYLASRWDA